MVQAILRNPALSLAIGISLVASLGLVAWFIIDNSFAMDFGVYHRAANEPLSTVYLERPVLNFPYAPTMLLWVSPLAFIPLWPAYAGLVSLSLAALILSCRRYLTVKELGLALISAPLVYALLNGQVTIGLTALLILACGTANRTAAGAAFAVILSIKPQLAILAPLALLVTSDWKALASFVGMSLAILAASILAFGIETWAAWISALDHFHDIVIRNGVLQVTITPASVAEYWGLPPIPFLAVGVVLGSWLVVRCRDLNPLFSSAAIAAGSLLASPYAIIYDLTAVIPFLVFAINRGNVPAAVALSGTLNPLPLILTAWQLTRQHDKSLRLSSPLTQ